MTRTVERPTTTDDDHEELSEQVDGESPDSATRQALNLAHRATEKFPDLVSRYSTFAGRAAVVSGALMALAGVAVARRVRRGQQPEEILDQITPEEIEQAATVTSRHNRWWRMIVRITRRRRDSEDESAGSTDDEPSGSP
jgi:hypothetical protein